MKVLVIDDDAVDRESVHRVLARDSNIEKVLEASTVEEGLAKLYSDRIDIVLVDYRMPGRTGLDFVSVLREQPIDWSCAVIVMSHSEDEDLALRCLDAGAQDFLPKREIDAIRLRRALIAAHKRFQLERELRKSYEQVRELAERDRLTGLYNRFRFEDLVEATLRPSHRQAHHFALLLMDLDQFKGINDHYGHETGDKILKEFSQRLKPIFRAGDYFARLGGDEFGVLITNLREQDRLESTLNRIREALTEPVELETGVSLQIGSSIGIAMFPADGSNYRELLSRADIAMYRAKRVGADFCFFEEDMQVAATRKILLDGAIRKALLNQEFQLAYQPIFTTSAELPRPQLWGFEALLRWRHEEQWVSPAEFIPVAEDNRKILEIGNWVLEKSLDQLRKINIEFKQSLNMSVNASSVQFDDEYFDREVFRVLAKSRCSPSQLELEITETAILKGSIEELQMMKRMVAGGISLALDDFGTGYSSISHLQRLPISTVKLDRSVMPGTASEEQKGSLLTGLAQMCASLGLSTVAEGIETEEQLTFSQTVGVSRFQGYHLAKPMFAQDLEQWMRSSGLAGSLG